MGFGRGTASSRAAKGQKEAGFSPGANAQFTPSLIYEWLLAKSKVQERYEILSLGES